MKERLYAPVGGESSAWNRRLSGPSWCTCSIMCSPCLTLFARGDAGTLLSRRACHAVHAPLKTQHKRQTKMQCVNMNWTTFSNCAAMHVATISYFHGGGASFVEVVCFAIRAFSRAWRESYSQGFGCLWCFLCKYPCSTRCLLAYSEL